MATILPKGIVVNTPQISSDIERIDKEPLASEELAKFWKVYTTTKRRLCDPTAERLENHWWRIWGSKKRTLNGATVARLFAEISEGQSFVPLHSTLKRDESGGSSERLLPKGMTNSRSSSTINSRQQALSAQPSQNATAAHGPAARPPPILKKARGPLPNGPRPTARFLSPRSSEDEADVYPKPEHSRLHAKAPLSTPNRQDQHSARQEGSNQAGRMMQGNIVRSSTPKYHSGNARGSSSQSSVDERLSKPQAANQMENCDEDVVDNISKQDRNQSQYLSRPQSQSRFLEDFSSSPETKSAPKSVSKSHSTTTSTTNRLTELELLKAGSNHNLDASKEEHSSDQKLVNDSFAEHSLSTTLDSGSMVYSRSASHDSKEMEAARSKKNETTGLEPPSLFAKRPVPTVQTTAATSLIANPAEATSSASNPLSRSKSQLTLLLERDREQREGAGRSSSKPHGFRRA